MGRQRWSWSALSPDHRSVDPILQTQPDHGFDQLVQSQDDREHGKRNVRGSSDVTPGIDPDRPDDQARHQIGFGGEAQLRTAVPSSATVMRRETSTEDGPGHPFHGRDQSVPDALGEQGLAAPSHAPDNCSRGEPAGEVRHELGGEGGEVRALRIAVSGPAHINRTPQHHAPMHVHRHP